MEAGLVIPGRTESSSRAILIGQVLAMDGSSGLGPTKTHIANQHIPKLWEFVELGIT